MDEEAPQTLADVKVAGNQPCPTCKKKLFTTYADGHGICGGCKYVQPPTEPSSEEPAKAPLEKIEHPRDAGLITPDQRSFEALTAVHVNSDTMRKMGYFTGTYNGERLQVAPVHDPEGTIVAQYVYKKDGTAELLRARGGPAWQPIDKMWLFGRAAFGDRFDKRVVVCQSPRDALAVAQSMSFKCAVTGHLRGLEHAAAELKGNYLWLARFAEIVLFYEATPEGLRKAQECAQIFPVGQVRLAKLEGHRTPIEALADNLPGDISTAVWSAATYRPKGIVNARDGRDEFVEEAGLLPQWPYPFEQLQDRTRGMRPGEMSIHVGGTGASKTTILYQYAAHLAKLPRAPNGVPEGKPPQLPRPKIGWLGFEDTIRSVKIGMLSAYGRRRLAINPLPKEEVAALHDSLFGDGDIELYDPETAEYNWEAIRGYVRYLAKALGCKVIIIDPLTFIVSIMCLDNERQAIDKITSELATTAKQLGIHLHVSHHLNRPDGTPHEEGARITLNNIKGSGGLAHFSSNVFAYERNQQGERSDLMRIRALKVRLTGFTGANYGDYHDHQIVKYVQEAGVYDETDEDWPEEVKTEGRRSSGKGGFSHKEGY